MKSKVGIDGLVTIPKRLRDRLGLQPGTVIDLGVEDGYLVGRKVAPSDDSDTAAGNPQQLGHPAPDDTNTP